MSCIFIPDFPLNNDFRDTFEILNPFLIFPFFSVDSPDLSPISESGRDFRHHQVRFAKFKNTW